jgi:hypothetical protein
MKPDIKKVEKYYYNGKYYDTHEEAYEVYINLVVDTTTMNIDSIISKRGNNMGIDILKYICTISNNELSILRTEMNKGKI